MRTRVALLAAVASLAGATPAAADNYTVTGSGDNSIPGGCAPAGAAAWTCNSLRGAVQESNARAGADTIFITVPSVTLSVGTLTVTDDLTVSGLGARATTVDATGAQAPAFLVSGAEANFGSLTIRGGTGGNLEVGSGARLGLAFARVTAALAGPGIVNEGEATITFSLIDGNPGGGIDSTFASTAATVNVGMSTIAGNGAFGVRSRLSTANEVVLTNATVARNGGPALVLDGQQDTSARASILGGGCSGGTLVDGSETVEDTGTCGLSPVTNRIADPQLATALSNQGGLTDVLTIPASSPAADYVAQCPAGLDQRGFQRPLLTPCDAGAYDRDATDPGFVQPPPTPEPPAPPAPTPVATPTPVANQTTVMRETRGTVRVQLPGSRTFVDLDATTSIPKGSTIDTRKGAVEITAVPKPGAAPEKATFYDGLFKVTQSRGITNLTLVEALACGKGKGASAAQKKPKKRKLWGDGKGSFRTTGRYSAATVRGTRWLVEDTCTTTTTRVTQGAVLVTYGKQRKVVRAGSRPFVVRGKGR